jgi:hypothetical protein
MLILVLGLAVVVVVAVVTTPTLVGALPALFVGSAIILVIKLAFVFVDAFFNRFLPSDNSLPETFWNYRDKEGKENEEGKDDSDDE